jgi:hypothetical protein
MLRRVALALLCFAHGAVADEKKDVAGAAKKLAEKPNYSWRTTTKIDGGASNWRPGPVDGKAEKNGYIHFTASLGDNNYEVAIKGDKQVIKRNETWESADDLQGENEWIARRLKAFKAPATEAEDLASKVKELKKSDGGLYSGDFTETGIKEILARGRRATTDPKNTKGWAKFWVKDGLLLKYEYNLQGTITVGDDQREIELNRTATVEIKDVGSTKIPLPEEAKKKLS